MTMDVHERISCSRQTIETGAVATILAEACEWAFRHDALMSEHTETRPRHGGRLDSSRYHWTGRGHVEHELDTAEVFEAYVFVRARQALLSVMREAQWSPKSLSGGGQNV